MTTPSEPISTISGREQRQFSFRKFKLLVLMSCILVAVLFMNVSWPRPAYLERIDLSSQASPPPIAIIERIVLSGADFQALWLEALVSLPDLKPIKVKPSITGNAVADARIQSLAEARGYRLQAESTVALVPVDGQPVHPDVKTAWERLVAAARGDGIGLINTSGFRSVDRQRQLFVSRFRAAGGSGYSNREIAAGKADNLLDRILSTSSIPGYSRHHTGYTVDIGDRTTGQAFQAFTASPGYRWMSARNYANARRFGFIPSYPPGAGLQGPDPEAWEFVWVDDLQIPGHQENTDL